MDEKSANDPAKEKIDWREHHEAQPYASGERSYEDFVPAYRTAQAAFSRHSGKRFEEIKTIWRSITGNINQGPRCRGMKRGQPFDRLGTN